jgi:hypothetical protein
VGQHSPGLTERQRRRGAEKPKGRCFILQAEDQAADAIFSDHSL